MQTLFEWDFANVLEKKQDEHMRERSEHSLSQTTSPSGIDESLLRNAEEFAPGVADIPFMKMLIKGILGKRSTLDDIIVKAAPDWPIDRISVIDRNILRIGLFELIFSDKKEVPAKVAINEAIELAKSFGGENSGKFVNGVLGAVYKEMGEPGKEETSKNKKQKSSKPVEVPYEKMLIQRLGGAVVYAREGDQVYLALVHDIFGHWTLSKGKLDPDEDVKDGTRRKIKEEIGLDIEIQDELFLNEYIANDPEKGKIRKQVQYFLGESKFDEIALEKNGGLDDARWFKLADILTLNFYDDVLPIVTKAINILLATK